MDKTSGERMEPTVHQNNIIYTEHYLRYIFASQFTKGKKVLDIASGSGYGSYYLATHGAAEVVGIDISEEAVLASQEAWQAPHLTFRQGNACSFECEDTFDVIVSFETLEHIADQKAYMTQLKSLLKPEGLLILSSPNKGIYPAGNPYHVQELTIDELEKFISTYFTHTKLLHQTIVLGSAIYDTALQGDISICEKIAQCFKFEKYSIPPWYTIVLASHDAHALDMQMEHEFVGVSNSNLLQEQQEMIEYKQGLLSATEGLLKGEKENAVAQIQHRDQMIRELEMNLKEKENIIQSQMPLLEELEKLKNTRVYKIFKKFMQ